MLELTTRAEIGTFQAAHMRPLVSFRSQLVPEKSEHQTERALEERPYRVFIHNDEVTPMDFVVHVLTAVFLVPSPNAEYVMYTAHLNGKAYVVTLPGHEARRRIGKAQFAARMNGFPLQFSMEAE